MTVPDRSKKRSSYSPVRVVLDHVVTLPDGRSVLNPMRVVANGEGSEVLFTLFQLPEMSDEQFTKDAGMVESDLLTLKVVLESPGAANRRRTSFRS